MTDLSLEAVPPPTPSRRAAPVVTLVPTHRLEVAPDMQAEPVRFAHRPRWSAFRYTLPGADRSAQRSSIWRELQAMGALKLQPGVWAVARRARESALLATLAERVRSAGGTAESNEVGHADRLDVRLQSRLDRSCERLWDDQLIALDWFESQAAAGALSPDEHATALDGVRTAYGATLPKDLVGSAASLGVADRLHRLGSAAPDRPIRPPSSGRVRARHRVTVAARWLRRDGATMLVARLHPLPEREWEAAFRSFESWAYRPSSTRAPLEHGMVRGVVPSDDVDGAAARIAARVASFESSLDPG
ncbi:MAG: Chromate resistance protein ChrB [Acidimicrobiales bacterium]